MNPLPVSGAKIHPPLLRADVLSRERLNTWLDDAVTGRLVLVVAEAGFGKTTLLADWARHARRRTAWYRLESDDRDWLTFIRHLVASGRELDPGFAPETYSRLMELGAGGPTQQELVVTLMRELSEFAAAEPSGLTLIFDDYHLIDRSDETEPIVRSILERTGPGFSVIIASRATPRLPLGRLRARGGVSRLEGDALRFDVPEADRLFRDAYHQPLDADVVSDLIHRTEGWPALLSLVHTSLAGAPPEVVKEVARNLSGGLGDMYDYLAEEVVDGLASDLAEFLRRTAILEEIDIDSASVVVAASEGEIERWLCSAEGIGLVSRLDAASGYRTVPVVREFLLAQLRASIGRSGMRELNLAVARRFEQTRWRTSATHFERAGESAMAARVIEQSLDQILGGGLYRAAADILANVSTDGAVLDILRSRLAIQIGATQAARSAADKAVSAAARGPAPHPHLLPALQNAVSVAIVAREFDDALDLAHRARDAASDGPERELPDTFVELLSSSATANLPALVSRLERLLAAQAKRRQWHYAAITSLNLAQVLVWLDRSVDALRCADEAERLFRKSSQGYETTTVKLVQALAKAHLGLWQDAEPLLFSALDTPHPEAHLEAVLEAACTAAWFGAPQLPGQILARVRREPLPRAWSFHWRVLDLWLEVRQEERAAILLELPLEPPRSMEVGAAFRWHLTVARAHLATGSHLEFRSALELAERVALAQASPIQDRLSRLLRCLGEGGEALAGLLSGWPSGHDALLGVFAEEVSSLLGDLTEHALANVRRAAAAQPHRWLLPLRGQLDDPRSTRSERAATLLEAIGEQEDISVLREFTRRAKRSGRHWGGPLVDRLAPRVVIEDLGLTSIRIGDRVVDGHGVRRKVLALVAFLASRPGGSATPDQVLEALWPDLDPEQGTNSLHQTVYFLRRVFDPDYRAGYSPEYLHFDSEVIWLDRILVDCSSWQCRRLLAMRPESQELIEALVRDYRGKFAPEFAYEDWAGAYRDAIHAGYLAVVERAVSGMAGSSDLHWRLWVGQQALTVDPEADGIEALVIRLYRALGAPVAAAEQYAHYASLMREQLGVDPPALEDL